MSKTEAHGEHQAVELKSHQGGVERKKMAVGEIYARIPLAPKRHWDGGNIHIQCPQGVGGAQEKIRLCYCESDERSPKFQIF